MISRIFPCKFSANSLDFRFRSLHALHIQNLWNCCRHYLVNFTNFLNLIFGGVFLFSPTVQPQPRTADSHDGLYRRVRGWPARGLQSSAGQCSVSAATELWHAFKVFFSTLSLLFFLFFFCSPRPQRRQRPPTCRATNAGHGQGSSQTHLWWYVCMHFS